MPQELKNNHTSLEQSGVAHILLLLAAVGVIIFVLTSSTLPFKNQLFSQLFPKPSSFAAEPDEIIVKFKPEVSDAEKEKILNSYKLKKEEVMETKDEVEVVEVIPAVEVGSVESVVKKNKKKLKIEKLIVQSEDRDRVIQELNSNPSVEYAELNAIGQALAIPNDPKYSSNQWNLPMISAPAAWDISQGNPSAVVAIMDSGVKSTHPDFVGKLVAGYNFVNDNSDTNDCFGHGTNVAGLVGANTNNGVGIASIGWNVKIMPLKVLDCGGAGSLDDYIEAIMYAADNGAKVINISFGLSAPMKSIQDVINYAYNKGVIVVAAAGNKGRMEWPAGFDKVIAVGSVNNKGVRVNTSGVGATLDVMAPGGGVFTTKKDGGYGSVNGTSFATPQVSALAALILSVKAGLNPKQLTDIITSTTDDISPAGRDDSTGWGRINVLKALQKALITNPEILTDSENPVVSILSPGNNTNIKETRKITVSAIDVGVGVAKVEFYIDGNLSGTITNAPYVYSWSTKSVSDGRHSIFVKAYDKVGNNSTSATLNLIVDNTIPTITISSPAGRSSVSGIVTIDANAADTNLAKVHFIIDEILVLKDNSAPYSYSWNTTSLANGSSHTIVARAFDKADNTKDISITLTVNNNVSAPISTNSANPQP